MSYKRPGYDLGKFNGILWMADILECTLAEAEQLASTGHRTVAKPEPRKAVKVAAISEEYRKYATDLLRERLNDASVSLNDLELYVSEVLSSLPAGAAKQQIRKRITAWWPKTKRRQGRGGLVTVGSAYASRRDGSRDERSAEMERNDERHDHVLSCLALKNELGHSSLASVMNKRNKDAEALDEALFAPLREAARRFDIPKTTLSRRREEILGHP